MPTLKNISIYGKNGWFDMHRFDIEPANNLGPGWMIIHFWSNRPATQSPLRIMGDKRQLISMCKNLLEQLESGK